MPPDNPDRAVPRADRLLRLRAGGRFGVGMVVGAGVGAREAEGQDRLEPAKRVQAERLAECLAQRGGPLGEDEVAGHPAADVGLGRGGSEGRGERDRAERPLEVVASCRARAEGVQDRVPV